MNIEQRLKSDLVTFMRQRDDLRTRTIRALIAAIDNARAVEVEHDTYEIQVGLGHDVERRELSQNEVSRIVSLEREDLAIAALEYQGLGQGDLAHELERRAAIVDEYLEPPSV